MSALDWPALMRAGMAGLRLLPRDFWQLTPAELRLMLGEAAAPQPLGRDRLAALMQDFPDIPGPQEKETTDG
ncbi:MULTISPECIES: rcc01693 family protein [unclassified Leisingera]|uniref:rcc01693 family protein n=1 Tax=unclassified Leisingera TaxID=2614906 RepID=UPI0010100C3F|nr:MULTISPECIES: rcc01693 family protein [unclassified Leisingera]MCF6432083.1 phage tail assembly chaperone [Leisingera sp. MMG026]QAX29761.1 phage tail assembly chaperone [Leisingera sp. NJS204]